jgi:hypothetical protein
MRNTYVYTVKWIAEVTVNNTRLADHFNPKTISTAIKMDGIVGTTTAIQKCPLATAAFKTDDLIQESRAFGQPL